MTELLKKKKKKEKEEEEKEKEKTKCRSVPDGSDNQIVTWTAFAILAMFAFVDAKIKR